MWDKPYMRITIKATRCQRDCRLETFRAGIYISRSELMLTPAETIAGQEWFSVRNDFISIRILAIISTSER